MKIGMVANMYKPYISGVTDVISLSKEFLEKAGHDVYVFTYGDEDYPDDEPNIIRSPGIPLTDSGIYLSLAFSKIARQLLYTMDIVHAHHPFLSGPLVLAYCKQRNIPILFTNHTRYDMYFAAYLPILPDVFGEAAMRAYLPALYRSCDLVVAPSNGVKDILINLGVTAPIQVIPNGVNLVPFVKIKTPKDRLEFGIHTGDVLLIYVGRLAPEKNLAFLLRAFAGTAAAIDHVHLLLVGDGPEKEDLEERIVHLGLEGRVTITGAVPYQDVPSYLAMADAFVTASVTEVHPLSIIEAMASGLPVLGIKSPGISDTIEDDVTGFLASQDLATFTALMVRLVTEHENRRQMGERAQQAAQQYDIRETTKTYIGVYDRLIHSARGQKLSFRTRLTRFLDKWAGW
jgi:glycosyltransferase involved in cell wall biosynthesis